jgi:hypothetical protein
VTRRSLEASPQTYARIGGVLYLFIIAVAMFGESFVRGSLIVSHDATATARNIMASETLFRVGLAGEMLTCVCDVAMAMVLYVLLKPVSRNLALLAAFFRLTFVAIYGVGKLFEVVALVVLGKDDYLNAFGPQQLHALAYMMLKVHGLTYGISLLFFGFCTLLFGTLIRKSGYLPRAVGVLWEIGGLCYVVFSLAQIVAPDATSRLLFPWLLLPPFIAELWLYLWLLVKGVDVPRWEARVFGPGDIPGVDRSAGSA